MDKVLAVYNWLMGPEGLVLMAALLAVSEALALIPQVKANSIFQIVVNGLKAVKEKLFKKPAA